MEFRLKKQIVIALIFYLILGGAGFLIYKFSTSRPSCFDGIQNQEEEKTDCGGPCEACKPEIKSLQIISTGILEIPNAEVNPFLSYAVLSQIKNLNTEFGGEMINYDFILYDNANQIALAVPGQSFILPGETKYVIEPEVKSDKKIAKAEMKIKNILWEKLRDYKEPRLDISRKKYDQIPEGQPGKSRVSGIVTNLTNFDFEKVTIKVILFGKENQIVGANTTQANTLRSNEERYFETTWFWDIEDVISIKIEAETNVFLDENFIKRYGTEEKYQVYY